MTPPSVCETLQGVDIHRHTNYLPDITTRAYELRKARTEEQRSHASSVDHASGSADDASLVGGKATDASKGASSSSSVGEPEADSPSPSPSVGGRDRVKFAEADMGSQAGEVAASDELRLEVGERSGAAADDGGDSGGGVSSGVGGGDEGSGEGGSGHGGGAVRMERIVSEDRVESGEGRDKSDEGDKDDNTLTDRMERMERMVEVMVAELKRLRTPPPADESS